MRRACVAPKPGMGSWLVFICGALMSMHVLGINLAPVLTVGGISGIVVGLSAQVGALRVSIICRELSACQGAGPQNAAILYRPRSLLQALLGNIISGLNLVRAAPSNPMGNQCGPMLHCWGGGCWRDDWQ